MNQDDWLQLTYLIGWLILATSALASFRLSWKTSVRMALVWVAIFTGTALLFTYFTGQ